MRPTGATLDFDAQHPGTAVAAGIETILGTRSIEARPAAARVVLATRREQLGTAAHAAVNSGELAVMVAAAKGRFGALTTCHPVLLVAEHRAPLLIGPFYITRHHGEL